MSPEVASDSSYLLPCGRQVGGLLSFNLIFPSDHPDIARLMG